jgi:hypothetical protein
MLPNRITASAKALQQIKDVTKANSEDIRKIWQMVTDRSKARELIDMLLNTHGVEYLGTHKRTNEHVYYCNAGDTYATTVLFVGQSLRVGCWGDMVEGNKIKEPECAF